MFASSSRWPITPFLLPKSAESSPRTHLSIFTPSRPSSPSESVNVTYTRSPSPVGSASSKTFAFFSSPHSTSGSEGSAIPADPMIRGRPDHDTLEHPKQRSLTEDFFSSPRSFSASLPSPPPSAYSRSDSSKGSRDPSPSDRDADLRSRLFPSRGNTDLTRERHISSPGRRGFRELETLDLESEEETPHVSTRSTTYFDNEDTSILSPDGNMDSPTTESILASTKSKITLIKALGHGTFSNVWLATEFSSNKLVAVKIAPRPTRETNGALTRLTFEREAQVLTHISHERIVPVLHSSLAPPPSPAFLVLEYIPGGDLLDLVNDDERYAALDEEMLKAMARELIGVVGWLHSEGIVHRDVKLENVLLPTAYPLPPTPGLPLIKLSDFGFARFIDPEEPLLSTRCGSEAYAAPELILGGPDSSSSSAISRSASINSSASNSASPTSFSGASPPPRPRLRHRYTASGDSILEIEGEGWYDGRETDTWAVGTVLFALICRALPFGEGPDVPTPTTTNGRTAGRICASRDRQSGAGGERERRSWLLRIAKGDWVWPEKDEKAIWTGARKMVERLLVRSRRKRASLQDVWTDNWLEAKHTWEEEMRLGQVLDRNGVDKVVWEEVN